MAFTILSMTLSLVAVFIPVLFMGGIVGRLLHEFAVTITAAILISGFVDQPDADAVQPLPPSATHSTSRPPLLVVRAGLRFVARAAQPDAAREPQYRFVTAGYRSC